MQRYIIIRMYRTEAMLSDVHDLSIEDCSRRAEELRGWARGLKAALFLADMGSDLAVGDAFAEVEHNFPLSEEQKRELAGMLSPFFRDGDGSTRRAEDLHNSVRRALSADGGRAASPLKQRKKSYETN